MYDSGIGSAFTADLEKKHRVRSPNTKDVHGVEKSDLGSNQFLLE